MLSRGITLEKFIGDMDKWLHGPKWLNDDQACWPEHELNCIRPIDKPIIQSHMVIEGEALKPFVPFDRFSTISKLVEVTKNII